MPAAPVSSTSRPLLFRALGWAVALACALWGLAETRFWQDIELKGFDVLSVYSAPGRSELPIVLVGIDDASLAQMQQRWPWPRGGGFPPPACPGRRA